MYNFFELYPFFLLPQLPRNCDLPPTIYSIMQAIANYGKEVKVPVTKLAEATRETIFNFNYPLSARVKKEDFEVGILEHFIYRRINYDTMSAFQIQLKTKLREIMPYYNKLLDSLFGWDLFLDGEVETKETKAQSTANTNNTLENNSRTQNIEDNRESNTPQNRLEEVRDGNYVSNYRYNTTNGEDNSLAKGNSISSGNNNVLENTKRSPANKIEIWNNYLENKNKIFTLIYKDLEVLFYGIL